MDDSKLKQCAVELNNMKSVVPVKLNGWEIYSLVAAVQMLKTRDKEHSKLVEIAETAATKIQHLLNSPLAREHLTEGWKLVNEKLADSRNTQYL